MSRDLWLQLEPAGRRTAVRVGTSLQDVLFEQGVEFPCGGVGTCGKCRVRVIKGQLDPCEDDVAKLGPEAVGEGWRLACRSQVNHSLTLEVSQWETSVLLDETAIEVVPRDGWGIAIDLGTTTVASQLVDLRNGNVLAVRSGLNPQAPFGADVMSRIQYAVTHTTESRLTEVIHQYLETVIQELLQDASSTPAPNQPLREVVIVGNTVMHHLFCGFDVSPLARCPFETPLLAGQTYTASQLQWDLADSPQIEFLPCLGGFIGSDVLAGAIAARMDVSPKLQVLADLGTNGEIVVADGARMLCAATAAGPAFEGARIQMGMRASCGAIDHVAVSNDEQQGNYQCHTIGNDTPVGICGSGLIDATACALEVGELAPNGRLTNGSQRLHLDRKVSLHQCDFRELQLAKGAIAAGIELLLSRLGKTVEDVSDVFLCGAFGNYLDLRSAQRIGLLPFPADKVVAMGNSALLGAKLALLNRDDFAKRTENICSRVEQVGLSEDQDFMDIYVHNMSFRKSPGVEN